MHLIFTFIKSLQDIYMLIRLTLSNTRKDIVKLTFPSPLQYINGSLFKPLSSLKNLFQSTFMQCCSVALQTRLLCAPAFIAHSWMPEDDAWMVGPINHGRRYREVGEFGRSPYGKSTFLLKVIEISIIRYYHISFINCSFL